MTSSQVSRGALTSAGRQAIRGPWRIVLVRHTETAWSRSGRHTGRTDLPLDEGGERHAVDLAQKLTDEAIDVVYSSPLRRALHTARLAGVADPLVLDELCEWDYGDYEGLTTPEIRAIDPDWELFADGCPAGECAEDVGARVDRVIEAISEVDTGQNVVVFAHGHLLRVFGVRWIGLAAEQGRHLTLDPGGVGHLSYERTTRTIAVWNS